MEGSRHERAVIVAISYVIGFTAAFLLFSNQSSNIINDLDYSGYTDNTATVIQATDTSLTADKNSQVLTSREFTYSEGRLEFSNQSGVKLLSFNPSTSGLTPQIDVDGQGTHAGEVVYSVSDNQNYVFFCEAKTFKDTKCRGYIYSSEEDVIYPVKLDGILATFTINEAQASSWSQGQLSIGTSYSANRMMPWILISEDATFDLQ